MKKQLSVIFLLLCCMVVSAQDKTEAEKLSAFVSNIDAFNHLYPQEKAYLHFDNTAYFRGEVIWFKAYVTTAEDNRPSPMSKVLYAELLNAEGVVLETKKLKLENGQAQGAFVLKDTYYAGFHQVRAYTNCMLNFDENIVFSRVFPVYDPPRKAGDYTARQMTVRGRDIRIRNLRKEEKTNNLDLVFFPEGGNLITGVGNRVAFRATGKDGKAADVAGKIYDNQGKEVTSFESLRLGMGSFVLFPDGNTYTAKVNYNNREYKFDLPQSMPSGYAMRVENLHPEDISVQIEKTADLPTQMLGISFACRGKVYAFKTIEVDSRGEYALRLPKGDLPPGVFQITLFTSQGEVLAQRQVFVDNNIRTIPIKTTNIQSTFEPFSPIEIDFEIKDANNNPVETTFSLSVKDEATKISTSYTNHILSDLLLSSDLKGHIEDPAYYFEADDSRRKLALDQLMLTQGWVRYPWKQMAGIEPFEAKHGIEKSLMIEGTVLSPLTVKPQKNINVYMWMTSKAGYSLQGTCMTEKDGTFNFGLADVTGVYDLNLWTKKGKKTYLSRISIHRNTSPPVFAYSYDETNPFVKKRRQNTEAGTTEGEPELNIVKVNKAEERIQEVEPIAMSYILPEVEVKGEIPPRRAQMQRLLVRAVGYYDVVREIDNYRDEGKSETGNILDFLGKTDPSFSYVEEPVENRQPGQSFFKVKARYKGLPVSFGTDPGWSIDDLSIGEVEHIIITREEGCKGSYYGFHIIINEDGAYRREPKGMRKTYYEGFAPVIEFYSPDYSIATLPEPDVRRTLYWNPDVRTDSLGRASVHFYNNGTCKKVSVSAEGLTDDGVPVMHRENAD